MPRAGLVSLDTTPLDQLSTRGIARRIAVVVQEAAAELPITVAEMVLLGRSPHRSSFQRYTAEDDRLAAQALVRVGARHLADRIFGTLSRGGTACPHRPHPWHNKPTTSFSTNRPTTSISATSTRSSNSSVPSTSPPSSCSTTSTSPPATATGWSPQPRQVACTGTPDEPLTSAILEPVYGVGVCRLSDNGTVQLVFRHTDHTAAESEA
ncbi:MAG: histidinol phosphatase [Pseudonocardiaceae bacterium]